jgi:hypothetical protein
MWPRSGGAVRISIHALMHVIEPDPEVGDCSGNRLHLYCLTGMHATNHVIVCSLICKTRLLPRDLYR